MSKWGVGGPGGRTSAAWMTIALVGCANTTGGGGSPCADASTSDAAAVGDYGAITRRDVGRSGACGALSLRQMQAPVASGASCTTPRTANAERVVRGTLDVALRDAYTLRPLLEWSGAARFTSQGFVVEIHEGSPDGPLVGPAFSIYSDTRMDGARAGVLSVEVSEIGVIPPQIGGALRAAVCQVDRSGVTSECPVPRTASVSRELVVMVYAFGTTDDGCNLDSEPFMFPVTVCCGCLLRFPVESDAPEATSPGPDCNAGTSPTGPASCAIGQDFPVDCRLCSRANPPFCQPRGYRAAGATMACPID